MNTSRPQSSSLLNVKDEIQVHLLVETALGDSREYEILSQEEVDSLKKSVQSLTARISQTRQNLAIQSKYRDAAVNMSRLYSRSSRGSADGDGKKRKSLLGHNRTPSHEVREAEQERQSSERRCEELAAELWSLEKRLAVPQSRLLRHTAGILQMTHKGPANPKASMVLPQNGIPGSPESMYTYHNSRNSMDLISEGDLFDERSLYKNADAMWDDGAAEQNGKELSKISVAESRGPTKEQMKTIAVTEQRLEELNNQLRDILLKANPQRELAFPDTPKNGQSEPLEILQSHLESLERNISTIRQDHDELAKAKSQSGAIAGNFEQTETVMTGLWDIIQSGENEARQRKENRRKTRTLQNLPDDEEDSEDEDNSDESFSLQGFSTKVQWLYTQATKLKEQKKVLQRQILQQRDLNSKSDATKDAELTQKGEELQRVTALLTRTEIDGDSVREQLSMVMEKLDEARQQERMRDQSRSSDESAAIKQVQEELNQRIQIIARLEEELQDMKDDQAIEQAENRARVEEAETKTSNLAKELALAVAAKATFDSGLLEKNQQIQANQAKFVEFEKSISQRDEDFASLTQTLQQKEQDLAVQTQTLQSTAAKLQSLESIISKLEGDLASQAKAFESTNAKLEDLQSSTSKRDQEISSITQALQRKEQEYNTQAQLLQTREQDITLNNQALESWETDFKSTSEKLKQVEKQLEDSNVEIARLTTEVTFARADLDSAYGSRAQRAADKAIDATTQKELDDLQLQNFNLTGELAQLREQSQRALEASKESSNLQQQFEQLQLKNFELSTEVAELRERRPASAGTGKGGDDAQIKVLKQELSETIEEFEAMTKASIEWERERESLEVLVDKIRDEKELLEGQLSDERVRWLGMKSPGMEGMGGSMAGGNTSSTVLRNEFRKMMKDTRDANTKTLRVSPFGGYIISNVC